MLHEEQIAKAPSRSGEEGPEWLTEDDALTVDIVRTLLAFYESQLGRVARLLKKNVPPALSAHLPVGEVRTAGEHGLTGLKTGLHECDQ